MFMYKCNTEISLNRHGNMNYDTHVYMWLPTKSNSKEYAYVIQFK